jgi:hypothetical protein
MSKGKDLKRISDLLVASMWQRFSGKKSIQPRSFCLMTGPPCSGTTAVQAWLVEQEGVAGLSESRILFAAYRFWQQVSRFANLYTDKDVLRQLVQELVFQYYDACVTLNGRLVVDKEPLEQIALPDGNYHEFVYCIRELFPDVKVIFIIRDPVATIWAMRNRHWGYSLVEAEPRMFSLEECIAIWKANASLILEQRQKPNTYLCRFEHLITEPAEASQRIAAFLAITCQTSFQPRPTRTVHFSEDVRQYILSMTSAERAWFDDRQHWPT